MSKLLKCKPVADDILQRTKNLVASLSAVPQVALVRVGVDPAAKGYQRSAANVLQQAGLKTVPVVFDSQITFSEFESQVTQLNEDQQIDAILLLEPLPESLPLDAVQDLLDPCKDIDGVTRANLGSTLSPRSGDLVPLTAAAVLELLNFYEFNLRGVEVVLIGDSLTVGRPLANLLLAQNATLTVCDKYTKQLFEHTVQAQLVITAVGQPNLLTADMVNKDAVVVDVGTNYDEAGKLVGDVDFAQVSQKVQAITPVPGGVGAITTALLAYRAARIASQGK